jgi:hypothetical protein
MTKYLNVQEEQGGTRRLFLGSVVVVAVIVIAAIAWPLLTVPNNSASGPRTDQSAGSSTVAKQTAPPPSASPNATTPETVGRSERIEATGTGNVALNADQRQALNDFAAGHAQQKMDHADFTIAVGAAVPQQVSLADMPTALTDKLAAYSGDQYFIVQNQLIIVEKSTRRIVAVVPVQA